MKYAYHFMPESHYQIKITLCEIRLKFSETTHKVWSSSKINSVPGTILRLTKQQVPIMKSSLSILFTFLVASGLSGCNSMHTNEVATACEQGIDGLNQRLTGGRTHKVHQTNLSRANSLLIAAQVQLQFAEYSGCVDKVRRAQDYLSGRQTAIISRLSI